MRPEILNNKSHRNLREDISNFVTEKVRPNSLEWENNSEFPDHLLKLMADKGFLGLSIPKKYSGRGKDFWHEVVLAEELAKCHSLGWALSIIAHTNMVAPLIETLGSESQKKNVLEPALKGEYYLALGATEEGSGSDLASVQTKLRERKGKKILEGDKYYITNGSIADYVVTLTKMRSNKDVWSLGFVIVDTGKDGVTSKKITTSGFKSGDTGKLTFKDCVIQDDMVLGKPGNGFYYLLKGIQRERLIGAVALNSLSLYILDRTLEFLRDRERFGDSLSKKQAIRHKIAELRSQAEASRQLAYNTVRDYVKEKSIDKEIIMVKITSYETAREVIDYCTHLHGAGAFNENHWLSHLYQDSQAFTLAAGSSEVMRDLLAGLLQM